jgi:hypothetical protein
MKLDVPGVRPAVIPEMALPALHELRKFRHFFRNAYILDLDPVLVRQRCAELLRVGGPVVSGLAGLHNHVRSTLVELIGSAKAT